MPRYGPSTALIVVDMQNDFAHPAGSLSVRDAESVIPIVNAEVAAAVDAGARVVYTQDWHPPSTPHFAKDGGIWPVHCVAGSWGAELHPDLLVKGPIVPKGVQGEDGYSGFSMRHHETGATLATELDDLLRGSGVERIVIVGLATDYCVVATALDARDRDYPTTVLAAGVRAVDLEQGDGARAIGRMLEAGVEVVPEAASNPGIEAADGRRGLGAEATAASTGH